MTRLEPPVGAEARKRRLCRFPLQVAQVFVALTGSAHAVTALVKGAVKYL